MFRFHKKNCRYVFSVHNAFLWLPTFSAQSIDWKAIIKNNVCEQENQAGKNRPRLKLNLFYGYFGNKP